MPIGQQAVFHLPGFRGQLLAIVCEEHREQTVHCMANWGSDDTAEFKVCHPALELQVSAWELHGRSTRIVVLWKQDVFLKHARNRNQPNSGRTW